MSDDRDPTAIPAAPPGPMAPWVDALVRTGERSLHSPVLGLELRDLSPAALDALGLARDLPEDELVQRLAARHGPHEAAQALAALRRLAPPEPPLRAPEGRYDVGLINVHAAGGMATYTAEIARSLAASGRRVLLVMDDRLGEPRLIEGLRAAGVHIDRLRLAGPGWAWRASRALERLARMRFGQLHLVHLLTAPIFAGLADRADQLTVHIEHWPEQAGWLEPFLRDLDCGACSPGPLDLPRLLDSHAQLALDTRLLQRVGWAHGILAALAQVHRLAIFQHTELERWRARAPGRVVYATAAVDLTRFCPAPRRSERPAVLVNAHKGDPTNFQSTIQRVLPARARGDILVLGADTRARLALAPLGCRCLERLPHGAVHTAYQQADWYCLLSARAESVSLGVLEAMACGAVPIVSPFVAEGFPPGSAVRRALVVLRDGETLADLFARVGDQPSEEQRRRVRAAVEAEHDLAELCERLFPGPDAG